MFLSEYIFVQLGSALLRLLQTVMPTIWIIPLATAICAVLVAVISLRKEAPPPPELSFGTGSMFDRIAPRYDLVNRVLALNLDTSWRRRMIRELELSPGAAVLDLATGTADVAILLADELKKLGGAAGAGGDADGRAGGSVLGLDPSASMLDVGRDKVTRRGHDGTVELRIGDARDLQELDAGAFDAVTMAFGIRNVPERDAVLCEAHRVLRRSRGGDDDRSGLLAILEFSEPDSSTFMGRAAGIFIRHVVPRAGAVLSGKPAEYMHLQNSIKYFPSPAEFVALMEEGVRCEVNETGSEGRGENGGGYYGAFRLEKLVQLNFGSVQLYIATPVIKEALQM